MEQKNWLTPQNDFWNDRVFGSLVPRYFNDFFAGRSGPSVDLHETDKEIVLTAEIPGVAKEDLDLTITNDVVMIKGETKRDQTREENGYHLSERRYGSFYRSVQLPADVISDQAQARYKNGILELRMPKAQPMAAKGYKPKIDFDETH